MADDFQFPYGAASILHGVAPQARTDVWIPLDPPADPELRARGRHSYVESSGQPDVSIRAAENELAVITSRRPDPYGPRGVRLQPLSEVVTPPALRRSLFVLLASVAIVLALASANVTNLSLVRTILRSREVAARAALGAGPSRLMRQFFGESRLLSLAAGAIGVVIASWTVQWLTSIAAAQLPRAHELALDARVFATAVLISAAVGMVVAVAPSAIARRTDVRALLQSGGHATVGGRLRRCRDALVIAEVGAALVLTTGAATLVRELVRLRATDPGMITGNVITFHLGEPPPLPGVVRRGPPPEIETRPFYRIAERVRQIPGVRAAGFTQVLPLQNWGWSANSIDFTVRGRAPRQAAPFTFDLRYITPGYFEALGVPIRRGRVFTDADSGDAPSVIIINETLARRGFAADDPVGQSTTRGTIVGVVADIRNVNLDQATIPELSYPIAQNGSQLSELGMTLVVGTSVLRPVWSARFGPRCGKSILTKRFSTSKPWTASSPNHWRRSRSSWR